MMVNSVARTLLFKKKKAQSLFPDFSSLCYGFLGNDEGGGCPMLPFGQSN
jgi:hypothetical protein